MNLLDAKYVLFSTYFRFANNNWFWYEALKFCVENNILRKILKYFNEAHAKSSCKFKK